MIIKDSNNDSSTTSKEENIKTENIKSNESNHTNMTDDDIFNFADDIIKNKSLDRMSVEDVKRMYEISSSDDEDQHQINEHSVKDVKNNKVDPNNTSIYTFLKNA